MLAPGSSAPWPNIQYEVYWGISKITDTILKTIVVWLPANAIFYGVSAHNDWSPVVPTVFCVASFPMLLRAFGKVPSWHNAVQTEAPCPEPEPKEQEDKRKFVGWSTEEHTKTTQRITWYTPPCPIPQARSYALALVNSHFEWIGEHALKGKANISGPNYRKLRLDWIGRGWCSEYGKKTIIEDRRTILKIAFDKPE